jgi:hypothetical protein
VTLHHPGQHLPALLHRYLRSIHMRRFGCRRRSWWIIVGERRRGTDQAADGGRRSECCEEESYAIDG